MKLKIAACSLALSLLASTSFSVHAAWSITNLGAPGIGGSGATDINDKGQIIGSTGYAPGTAYGGSGFLYENGSLTLAPGFSDFRAINASGQIVGGDSNRQSFIFQNGQASYLPTLGGAGVMAYGINDAGHVVGMSNPAGSNWLNAFVYSNGTIKDYGGLPGAISTYAYGINNSGAFTGISFVDNSARSFVYQNGAMTDLGSIGGSTYSQSINNAGQVVGWGDTNSGNQAFLYSEGKITNFGDQLGVASSRANDINDRGQIVGSMAGADGSDAFLYSNGEVTNLSTLAEVIAAGWSELTARAINNLGDIVGIGRLNGDYQAFVLSSNTQYASPTTFSSFAAPEIDGGNAMLGIAILGGFISLMRRRQPQSAA